MICTPLKRDEVERVFRSVVEEAKAKVERRSDSDTSYFTLLMTKQFIIDNFGLSVFQIISGESIVLYDEQDSKVYKYPLTKSTSDTLSIALRN